MGVDCDYPNPCRCGCHFTDDDVLGRESFLRHLHTVSDTPPSAEELSPSEVALSRHDAAMRLRANESKSTHRLLTRFGVPEQIPPFKTPLAPLCARVQMALLERDAARAALTIERKKGGTGVI